MKNRILTLTIAAFLPTIALGKASTIQEKILASAQYKNEVKKAQKNRASLSCGPMVESVETGDLSNFPGMATKFQLVVLQCYYNPHDGGDAIRQAGLAVIGQGEVLSFTIGYVAQPD